MALTFADACAELPGAMAAALDLLPAYLHGHGYDSYGLPVLREAVARRYTERGLPTAPGQIFVTGGAQHAFDLLLRCLVSPLDPVLVESPTYPNALDALARARARVVAVGLAPEGWDIEAFVAALRQSLPRLAYLMPDFHNPAGHLMRAQGPGGTGYRRRRGRDAPGHRRDLRRAVPRGRAGDARFPPRSPPGTRRAR